MKSFFRIMTVTLFSLLLTLSFAVNVYADDSEEKIYNINTEGLELINPNENEIDNVGDIYMSCLKNLDLPSSYMTLLPELPGSFNKDPFCCFKTDISERVSCLQKNQKSYKELKDWVFKTSTKDLASLAENVCIMWPGQIQESCSGCNYCMNYSSVSSGVVKRLETCMKCRVCELEHQLDAIKSLMSGIDSCNKCQGN